MIIVLLLLFSSKKTLSGGLDLGKTTFTLTRLILWLISVDQYPSGVKKPLLIPQEML
jgi:hypothetical protein